MDRIAADRHLRPAVPAVLDVGFMSICCILLSPVILTGLIAGLAMAAIAAVTVAAAYASHVRLQREQALFHARLVADVAQKVLLRPMPRRVGGVEVESLYLAAQAQARIGGDFYEAADTPYGVRLLIGDVRGKGLSAVGTASAVVNSFREAAYDEPDLGGIARRLETSITRHNAAFPAQDPPECFAIALLAEIPNSGDLIRILNCGHPPPLLLHRGEIRALEPTAPSPPLNLAALIGDHYSVDAVAFACGDQLLFYTDGVTEARNRTGEFFPLRDWMRQQTPTPPRELLDRLHRDLLRHSSGGLNDDIAALAVRSASQAAKNSAGPA
ncbi:PP2C family protein-serine/threonine phosphatase [Streptomyces sp. NPDC052236]|uniref:PP2C family protein-serine/threonine phosphatase n=1 Tax=Streptomyces sp. NPDC052236 TaxID=3365686 RepID=UPI0037D95B71